MQSNAPSVDMTFHPRSRISPPLVAEVVTFLTRFVDAEADYLSGQLREHTHLVTFREGGSIVGAAAVDIGTCVHERREVAVIFTSNTVLDPRVRGANLIQRCGFASYLRALVRHPGRPIYWLLDTFSYKSYLLLARNLVHFWPRRDDTAPRWEAGLLQQLAEDRYGPRFRRESGVVSSSKKHLREWVATIGSLLQSSDADVAHFVHLNPGFARGDGLVCLAPLDARNWWSIAVRALARGDGRPRS